MAADVTTLKALFQKHLQDMISQGAEQGSREEQARENNAARLSQMLQGKQADQQNEMAKLKQGTVEKNSQFDNTLKQMARLHGIDTAQPNWKEQLGDAATANGESMAVSPDEFRSGADPRAKQDIGNKKNEEAAYQKAMGTYNKGTGDINTVADAVQTGVGALKANDASSLGQLRAAMLAANGFKRFNEPEALANAPDSVKSQVAGLLNKYGLDTDGGNLSDIQRQNALKFFNGKAQELADKHGQLKAQALSQYGNSSYADPNHLQMLQGSVGAPVDQRIGQIKDSLGSFNQAALPGVQGTSVAAPSPSLFDQLKAKLRNPTAAPPKAPSIDQPPRKEAPVGVRVRDKATGIVGTWTDSKEFDPSLYDKVQ